jgi:hypothetical protein
MRACAWYGVAWQSVITVGEAGGGVFEGIDPAQERNDLEPLKLDPRPPACIDMICMQVHVSGRQPTPSTATLCRAAPAKCFRTAQSNGDNLPP